MTITPEEIAALIEYVTKSRLPVSEATTTFEQVRKQKAAVDAAGKLRSELARVTAERDEANEALTVAYLAGEERGKDSAFERGRRAGLEAAAKIVDAFARGLVGGEFQRLVFLLENKVRALIDNPADAESEARNG